jgi:hypothetical protein
VVAGVRRRWQLDRGTYFGCVIIALALLQFVGKAICISAPDYAAGVSGSRRVPQATGSLLFLRPGHHVHRVLMRLRPSTRRKILCSDL